MPDIELESAYLGKTVDASTLALSVYRGRAWADAGGGRPSFLAIDAARSLTVSGGPFSHPERSPAAQLDLRPPGTVAPTLHVGGGGLASESFPAAIHPGDAVKENMSMADRYQSLELTTGELNFRVMGQAETLVRRIHREGLPVARLWESKSALLSIGLSPRGKPGLWLTQKIH
jgi:hypothetical protein